MQGEVVLKPGRDLEGGPPPPEPAGPHPKSVSGWVYWRANVLYWLATLIFVPLTSECWAARGWALYREPRMPCSGSLPACSLNTDLTLGSR